LIAWY